MRPLVGALASPRLAAAVCLAVVAALMVRAPAIEAHPLGNFTVNCYSRIELGPGRVSLRYVLDMAEVPAFQEMMEIDLNLDGAVDGGEHERYLARKVEELRRGLGLTLDGRPVDLRLVSSELSFPAGQAGLSTLRLSMLLDGGALRPMEAPRRLVYRDDNYPGRVGWREIVVQPNQGVQLLETTAPERDSSDELRSYPAGPLGRLQVQREASATFVAFAAATEGPSVAAAMQDLTRPRDPLASLVTPARLTVPLALLSALVAAGLGALHAVSPGHGKTVMAAYLVGTRGTVGQALFLGLTVAVSHTVGVLALGALVFYASHVVAPERLYPWLGLTSGIAVAMVGAWLLVVRLRSTGPVAAHGHEHPHGRQNGATEGVLRRGPRGLSVTWKGLAALGTAGGLVPSASALVLLLAAVSLGRPAFGLLLIVAFSAGMAIVLAGTGLLLVHARRLIERSRFEERWGRLLPALTAPALLVLGLITAARAALELGLV